MAVENTGNPGGHADQERLSHLAQGGVPVDDLPLFPDIGSKAALYHLSLTRGGF